MARAQREFTHLDDWFKERNYKRNGNKNPVFWFETDRGLRCQLRIVSSTIGCGPRERHIQFVYLARVPKLAWLEQVLQGNSSFHPPREPASAAPVAWETLAHRSNLPWKNLDYADQYVAIEGWDDRWKRIANMLDDTLPDLWELLNVSDYRPVLEEGKYFSWLDNNFYTKILSDIHVGDTTGALNRANAMTVKDINPTDRQSKPGKWTAKEELEHVQKTIADYAAGQLKKPSKK